MKTHEKLKIPYLGKYIPFTIIHKNKKQKRKTYVCLTPKQEEAVKLVYLENERGLSQSKVAAKLGISRWALRDRLRDALQKMNKESASVQFPRHTYRIATKGQTVLAQLKAYMFLLTPKQAEAVRLVYLENKSGLSQLKVAQELGICRDSLKERLKGALRTIQSVSPCFKFPKYRRSSKKANNLEDKKSGGFYQESKNSSLAVRTWDPDYLKIKEVMDALKVKHSKRQESQSPKKDIDIPIIKHLDPVTYEVIGLQKW